MIPKKIHYCWFGRNPLPDSALKCIASWRKYLPDYEIIEWNEDNYDVTSIPYIREAYEAKKYAFVSDYARFALLYKHGGLYFDTDVEVIKSMDALIAYGPFLGFELNPNSKTAFHGAVNPGLGMGAVPSMDFYKKVIDYYRTLHFILPAGSHNITDAVVNITTRELVKAGLQIKSDVQTVDGIHIYPADYFNPFDDMTGKLNTTPNTFTIHWFSKTWLNVSSKRTAVLRFLRRTLGINFINNLSKLLRK